MVKHTNPVKKKAPDCGDSPTHRKSRYRQFMDSDWPKLIVMLGCAAAGAALFLMEAEHMADHGDRE